MSLGMSLRNFLLVRLVFGKKEEVIAETVFLPDKGHYERFSTIFEFGYKGTYQGDYVGANTYSLIPREQYYPIKYMLFCNLLLYVPNHLWEKKLTSAERIKRYGPRGALTFWQASQMYQCELGLEPLNKLTLGLIPGFSFLTGKIGPFCTRVFVPSLARLASEVVIPKPVMLVLRSSAFGVGMFFNIMDTAQLGCEIWGKVRPYFEHDKTAEEELAASKSYKTWKEQYDAIPHGLMREYADTHEGYKHMYFLYRPLAWIVIFDTWWMTNPLWSRLTRVGDYQVHRLKNHHRFKGRDVITGGTRIRYPGRAGSNWKIETGLAYFSIGFVSQFFIGFATGNLFLFGFRV